MVERRTAGLVFDSGCQLFQSQSPALLDNIPSHSPALRGGWRGLGAANRAPILIPRGNPPVLVMNSIRFHVILFPRDPGVIKRDIFAVSNVVPHHIDRPTSSQSH